MSEAAVAKVTDDPKDKEDSAMWGFFKKTLDFIETAPVSKILLFLGLLMVVLFAIGGFPKAVVFNAIESRNVLVLGILLIASSLAMQVVSSGKFQGKFGHFHLIFPFMMLATGIFSIALVTLSHLGVFELPKSDRFRTDLDEVVIVLALASWCGFIPAYLSARLLKTLPTNIETQMSALTEQQKTLLATVENESNKLLGALPKRIEDELVRLKIAEEHLVNHVTDATRAMYKGFDEVFARAFAMIKDAQGELILVNFAMNFGSAHRYNSNVVQRYKERNNGADLAKDVGSFLNQLKGKIVNLDTVQILTVTDEGALNKFLKPLSRRNGYEELLQLPIFSAEQDALIRAKASVAANIDAGDCDTSAKCMTQVESLPIQLLITGLARNGESPRTGCLVFMVGSEMLQTDVAPGSEPGFYTELPDMVDVFRSLALALIRNARNKAGSRAPKTLT
jgi:hypothetical protein